MKTALRRFATIGLVMAVLIGLPASSGADVFGTPTGTAQAASGAKPGQLPTPHRQASRHPARNQPPLNHQPQSHQPPDPQPRAAVDCLPSTGFTDCIRYLWTTGTTDQTFTVPAGVTSVQARLWGAGGGGGNATYYSYQYGGGGGAFTSGTIAVTPGQTLTVTAGQSGVVNGTTSTYGGGGAGGGGTTDGAGASGGGMSALWNGTSTFAAPSIPLLIAGGGGGSSPGADTGTPAGGGGGGTTGGQDNVPASSGRGGTQSAGGAGATQTTCGSTKAGAKYQGGAGATSTSTGTEGGGGGGGGYYGGGGGACQRSGFNAETNGMGGGGSGYTGGAGVTAPNATNGVNGSNSSANGTGGQAAGTTDDQYITRVGAGGGTTNGGPGLVVIQWVTKVGLSITKVPNKNPYIPGQPITYTITVSNAGPAPAVAAQVTDTMPTGLTGVTWACAATGANQCNASSGTGNIATSANIAAGGNVVYTVTGNTAANATGSLNNQATVTRPANTLDDNCNTTCTSTANPIPPGPQASMTISKVLLTSPVVPGKQIQWRVTVTNNGPSQATNVVVTDQVPTNLTATTMKADQGGATCPITSNTATCPAVMIPPASSLTWTLSGTLSTDATAAPTNTAVVTGGPDPSATARTATAATATASPQSTLSISKALLTNPVVPGQTISWQVVVINTGPSRARNVAVTDQIPTGVLNASMSADRGGATCPITAGIATCPAVEIAVGDNPSWTITGTLDPNATTTPTNTATVTGGPDPSASSRTAAATPTTTPSPQANLTISKVLLTNPVVPGQSVSWQVTVHNNGPSRARNIVITDQVPGTLTNVTMSADQGGATCPITSGRATCPATEIPAGSSLTWTMTGTLDSNASVTPTNTATVTGGPDPSATSRTAAATPSTTPLPHANLTISKVLLTNPVVPGQPISWRVSVTNNGPSLARNVVVTDQVPANVTNASMAADPAGAPCPITSGLATCPAVEIPVGQTLTWTMTGTLDPNATLTPTNTATVTGGPDPSATAHTAVATPTTTPSFQANLTISKVLLTNPVVPGQPISWRVSVTNHGPSLARNVAITDHIPAGVNNASMSADPAGSPCPITSGTATCPAVTIPPSQTMTWTMTGTLDPAATLTPTNTATVTGGPDPSATAQTAIATPSTTPSPQANLTIAKILLTNPVVPGQAISWRVSVTNNGPSLARNVVVTDQIPTGVLNPSMSADPTGPACPIASSVASCPAVQIPVGQTTTWTMTGTLDPAATVTPNNTATVTGGPDPSATARTAVATPSTTPSFQANLTFSKVLLTNPVVPGQAISWQVSVINNGPSRARNVVVTDQIPTAVSNPTMSSDQTGTACPITSDTATCPAVEIPVGQTLTWTITGTLDPNATVAPTNTAVVTGGPDPSATARTAVATPSTAPSFQANLTFSKILLTTPVVPGQSISWQVAVTNNGPSLARNVVVTDQIPTGVLNPSMSADQGGTPCPIVSGVAACPAVEVPVGQTLTWTMTGTLDSTASVTPTNTASVTGGPDPSATARTAVATPSTTPSLEANLTFSKALLTNPVVPGQAITWQVAVTNNGPSLARNVVVTDQVPVSVSGASMSADPAGPNCPITSGVATCPAVEIPVGQTLTWTVTGTLDSNATTTPTNTAVVTGGPDPSATARTAVATPNTTPNFQANLTFSKVLLTNPVVPGQAIAWQITATNNGPSRARNVVVTDQIPAEVLNPSMSADQGGANCPISSGLATCPAVEIPAGQTMTWIMTGTLDPNASVTPTNTATVTGGPDPSATARTAVATPSSTPSPQANLTVAKVLLTNPVVPGQSISWQVSVTNNGPSRARDVVVTDQVPPAVTNASMSADSGGASCPITSSVATCPAVEIPAGQTLTWTMTGTLDPNATVTPTNTTVVTGGPDPSTAAHTAVATPTGTPQDQANLTISKVLQTNPVVPGQPISWQVSVTNNGPSRARNVVVTDQIPAAVTNASMSADSGGASCPITSGVATCPAAEIPVGQTLSWTVTGTLDSDTTVTPTNAAVVTGGPDPSATARTAVATSTTTPSFQANLTFTKVLLTNPVIPGQSISWQVSVTNNGPSRARNVVVTDQVPPNVDSAMMLADPTGPACPISSGIATCPAVEIPSGQTMTWTISGTLDSNATITPTNTATVTGGPDPSATAHTAVATPSTTPLLQANLTISKVLLTNPVVPGQQIQWQVSVTNNGPSRARNVVVTDQVPASVNNASMSADPTGPACPISSGIATCPAVEIPTGQTLTWTMTGALNPNATVTPTNIAIVTGGPDPSATARTAVASPSTTPQQQARLTVSKVLLTSLVIPGQQIQWQVSVTNNGPSRAQNVVVTDQVPAGVNNASMSADQGGARCPITSGQATCPSVQIPVGQTLTWTMTGTLDPNAMTTPTNTAVVTGGPDPSATAHIAVATPTTTPSLEARLTVSKVLLTNPVVAGKEIQWQVSVTNNGPSRARDVVVTDQVPLTVNNASMSADQGGAPCPITSGVATCPATEIPVGQTLTWTMTGTLAPNATVSPSNTAIVTGGPDPSATAHTAVATPGALVPSRDLHLLKGASPTNPGPGSVVTYTVTATNLGTGTYHDAVITDDLSDLLTNADYNHDAKTTTGETSYVTPTLIWTTDIQPGTTSTLTYTVTVHKNAGGKTLTNHITAQTDGTNCPALMPLTRAALPQPRAAVDPACSTNTTVVATKILPRTGAFGTTPLALLGSGLVLAGAGTALAGRRRRKNRR